MGNGQYVRLGFSGSLERAQADLSFTEPHFLDRNVAAGFDVFAKTVDFTASNVSSYSESDIGGDLRMGFPIANNTQLGLRYKFQQENIFNVASNASLAVKESQGIVDVSSVGFTVAYDTRNLPQSPTSGVFLSFSEDLAGVGGDVDYFRSVVDARGYYPLTKNITLVGRMQGGAIEGWNGQDVRLTDIFLKGGETIRGFQLAGYGPRDACTNPTTGVGLPHVTGFYGPPFAATFPTLVNGCTTDPLGGQVYWAATAEARFPMPFLPDNLGMQGAVFVDAGSLFDPSPIATRAVAQEGSFINDGSAVRLSTGFSIIWQSPLGPLRADIGDAILKQSYDRTEIFRFGASTAF
jgi:outer membrane protein insertion porin family